MIYLDTHVVLWLYEGLFPKLSKKATELIKENELLVSAMVTVELQFLYEIKRTTKSAEKILSELQREIGLTQCNLSLHDIAQKAITFSWTRDPFDRIIVANAMSRKCTLVTKDESIRKHYSLAAW